MTQPTNDPSAENERLKRIMERGARTTLDTKRRFAAPAARLQARRPIVVDIAGTDDLTKELAAADTEVHVVLDLEQPTAPDFAALVFLNTPDATANTPLTAPGYAGAIAFFGSSDANDHHSANPSIRLSVTGVIRKLGATSGFTATLVPVPYSGRSSGRQTVTVTASLEVVVSKVVKNS